MNSLSFASSLLRPSTCKQPPLFHRLRVHSSFLHWYSHNQCHNPYYSDGFSSIQFHLPNTHHTLVRATSSPEEGVVAVMNFEELVEKDGSFLESDNPSSKEHDKKIDQIISAANIAENSKVLVSIGSEEFVDRFDDIFKTLASRCSPGNGARVVISPLQGRQALEQQRQKYPDIVVSDLPEKMKLEKVASEHSFWLKDFVDDSSLYLAVLELKE